MGCNKVMLTELTSSPQFYTFEYPVCRLTYVVMVTYQQVFASIQAAHQGRKVGLVLDTKGYVA